MKLYLHWRKWKYLPQCCRVDIGSRGKHWQVFSSSSSFSTFSSSSVLFEAEQQVGWWREGEMYLVRLRPPNSPPPAPTQASEGVATNDWLSCKLEHFSFSWFPDFPSSYPAVCFFFTWTQGQQLPLCQGGEHLLCYPNLGKSIDQYVICLQARSAGVKFWKAGAKCKSQPDKISESVG